MKENKEAEVHKDLEGFQIRIDPFGNIQSNFTIDRLNEFLDEKVDDKKLDQVKGTSEEE